MAVSYSSAVKEIKEKSNIVDIINPLVPLKRAGSNWKGCCPFHKEKTPSFVVSEDRQHYHCFGCGEDGDAIKFVEKYYNIGFTEAVERLAAQYGIAIDRDSSEKTKSKEPYYEVNRLAARYFYDIISRSANRGYTYMANRDMDAKTLQFFGIGYTGENPEGLSEYLVSRGISKDMLLELGLSRSSSKTGRLYDVYRGRVMFPIFNVRGNLIGFGGRTIEKDAEPKYLNSSDSYIFEKRNNLYGLNRTKSAIQEEGFAIIVEGYMDCVSLYKHGVKNVAASLGTALTEQQAKLLSKYTNKVVLCYDADGAGIRAALRGIDVLRSSGLEVRVLHVDDGKDPDEYIKKHGKDAFMELVNKKAVADIDYKVANLKKSYNLEDHTQIIKFLSGVAEILKVLPPVEADIYIQRISSDYGISEGALKRQVEDGAGEALDPLPKRPVPEENSPSENISESDKKMEEMLLRLILTDFSLLGAALEYPEAFVTKEGRSLAECFRSMAEDCAEPDINSLKSILEEPEYNYINFILNNVQPGEDTGAAFADCIGKLNAARRKKRIKEIYDIIEMSDSLPDEDKNTDELRKLMEELKELHSK